MPETRADGAWREGERPGGGCYLSITESIPLIGTCSISNAGHIRYLNISYSRYSWHRGLPLVRGDFAGMAFWVIGKIYRKSGLTVPWSRRGKRDE